jgi:branched-subunit amino acid transport protein
MDRISTLNLWLVIVLAGALTYAIRLSFILLFGKWAIPPMVRRALRFVPPAVLTAIIIPELLLQSGALNVSFSNLRLIAGLLAIVVAWRTKNVILTILAGMVCLYLLQWLAA